MKISKDEFITILLADDDEDDRELFADIIHQVNGPVKLHSVSSGNELISRIAVWSGELPHLLFLDLNMPGIDGRACLTEMKKHKSFRDTHVIICSTSSSPDDINYAYEKGADLYLIKPNKFSNYFTMLKNVLNLFINEKLPVRDRQKFVFS
ncbi:MAG: response regulator [Bacteroidetes bacterium]|nr:response regulator [Bacteroidota bacterium]